MYSKVNDVLKTWLNKVHGALGEVTATRGPTNDYLEKKFKFWNGEVKIDVIDYVKGMLTDFPIKLSKENTAVNPTWVDMFKGDESKRLSDKESKWFHKMITKALFACK